MGYGLLCFQAQHLSAFAAEAGAGLRVVRAQMRELCEQVLEEATTLAEDFRDSEATIVTDIVHVKEQRMRKARSQLS